jgi:hypothetical protein
VLHMQIPHYSHVMLYMRKWLGMPQPRIAAVTGPEMPG